MPNLTNIYDAIKTIAPTYFSIAPQSKANTFPRVIIQQVSEIPAQTINGTETLRECMFTVSSYGTSYAAAKEIADSVAIELCELENVWLDSEDISIEDKGTADQIAVHRVTQTYTYFTYLGD